MQRTFASLEMHSKRRYKICTCSVILGQLSLFEITRASLLFSRNWNFRWNLKFYERRNFSYSTLHHIFESQNVRFPFSTRNSSLIMGSSVRGPLEYQPIRAQQKFSRPIRIAHFTHVTYWRHNCPYMGMIWHVTPWNQEHSHIRVESAFFT